MRRFPSQACMGSSVLIWESESGSVSKGSFYQQFERIVPHT
jgi:hypothetical protein